MPVSTVHKILRRYQCPPLAWIDPATGMRVRSTRRQVRRYVRDAPGELVHLDIKKLGRVPDGGGHRVHGRAQGTKNAGTTKPRYWYLHIAIDDHSRLAYSELLEDERKETAARFWRRATAYFNSFGITVQCAGLGFSGPCVARATGAARRLYEDWLQSGRARVLPGTNGL